VQLLPRGAGRRAASRAARSIGSSDWIAGYPKETTGCMSADLGRHHLPRPGHRSAQPGLRYPGTTPQHLRRQPGTGNCFESVSTSTATGSRILTNSATVQDISRIRENSAVQGCSRIRENSASAGCSRIRENSARSRTGELLPADALEDTPQPFRPVRGSAGSRGAMRPRRWLRKIGMSVSVLRGRPVARTVMQDRLQPVILLPAHVEMLVHHDSHELLANPPAHETRLACVNLKPFFQGDPAHLHLKSVVPTRSSSSPPGKTPGSSA